MEHYTQQQRLVLEVRPGITDHASIEYRHESRMLSNSGDPGRLYLEQIMPDKLKLNQDYIQQQSLGGDLLIILKTIRMLFA